MRAMHFNQATFVVSAANLAACPPDSRAEVAFAGRSNAGKSSAINAITGQSRLARISKTPGRTQLINFFSLPLERYLVDLPGYGFADAPVAVVEKWQALLRRYLSGRQTLRRAFVLVDSRHGIKPVDDEIMTLLDQSAVTFQCVMTKIDKVKEQDRARVLDQVREKLSTHPAAFPEIVLTSSEKGLGIDVLRSIIAGID